MLNIKRQPQTTAVARLFSWTRTEPAIRRKRSSWVHAFAIGLADLGDARVLSGILPEVRGDETEFKPR